MNAASALGPSFPFLSSSTVVCQYLKTRMVWFESDKRNGDVNKEQKRHSCALFISIIDQKPIVPTFFIYRTMF